MSKKSIPVQSVAGETKEEFTLIDVRSPAEFKSCHPEGAVNIPLDRLDPTEFMANQERPVRGTVYLTCLSGTRAKMAQDQFAKAGFSESVVVEGGLKAWQAAGLPVVESEKSNSMSIDCQARIVIGSLVVLGIGIGWTVHPIGFAFSALVGGGLIFAGVTDTCAIAMILARMPWNRGNYPPDTRSCSV